MRLLMNTGYLDRDKSKKDNYLLYFIRPNSPSSLHVPDSKLNEYISSAFYDVRKDDKAPAFMTVRELLSEINNT